MSGLTRRLQQAANTLSVIGPNLLTGKAFTSDVADSSTETGHPIANATDGDINTRWISQPSSPVNITADLGGVYDLTQLIIVFAADTIKDYIIGVSIDNSTYTQIASGVTNNTQKQTITISSFTATAKGRYLRITGTDRWNTSYGNSIWEVAAYGTLDSSYPTGTIDSFVATAQSDTSIELDWTYSGSPLSGFTLQRAGSTIASPTASTQTYTDTGLTAGTTYTYSLTGNFSAGGTTSTQTASTKTTGGTNNNAGWLSGISNIDNSHIKDGSFSAWRGEPCTCYRFWLNGSSQADAGYYFKEFTDGFTGTVDYAIGAPPADGVSWQSAASGGYDSQWHSQMQGINANWTTQRAVYLAPAHEMNGNWYEWSVNDTTTASYFQQAWQRFYGIVQQELVAKGRIAKVTLNYAAGQNMVEAIWPGNDYVDFVGFDIYDHYLPTANGNNCLTESDWDNLKYATTSDGSPRGPYAIQQYAASKGKPFAMPEWGLSDSTSQSTDPTLDNPFWIQKMHDFYAQFAAADKYNPGAGDTGFENIFSSEGGDAYHLSIWPATSQNPNASAMYQSLSWGE